MSFISTRAVSAVSLSECISIGHVAVKTHTHTLIAVKT